MARKKNRVSPEVAARLVDIVRELRPALFGPEGYPAWGTKFSEIEDVSLQAGLEVARLLMEQAVSVQAGQVPPESLAVQGEAAQLIGDRPVVVETAAGDVEWSQKEGRLPRTRRAFFPSGDGVGG